MKTLILIAFAFITLQAVAQDNRKGDEKGERNGKREMMKDLSPEEMATLGSKKMTLALDLSIDQQAKVKEALLEQATIRKQNMVEREKMKNNDDAKKPTKEERVEHLNAKLDTKIAMKQKMKSILTAEQYEKWTKMKTLRQHKSKGKKRA
jgi:protein CpxP